MDTKETVKLLKELQASLQHLQELEQKLEQHPRRIAGLEKETKAQKLRLEKAEERLKELKVHHATKENDFKSLQDEISDKNLKTLEVKTNEQLWAMQKEIKHMEENASNTELEIIQAMEDIEKQTADTAEVKKEFERDKKENDAEIAALKKEIPQVEKDLETAQVEFKELAKNIPSRYAKQLERIQRTKGGSAMALVQDSICTACNYRIRPQAFMEVKMGTAIHQCPSCSRILYYKTAEEAAEE